MMIDVRCAMFEVRKQLMVASPTEARDETSAADEACAERENTNAFRPKKKTGAQNQSINDSLERYWRLSIRRPSRQDNVKILGGKNPQTQEDPHPKLDSIDNTVESRVVSKVHACCGNPIS
jgi:hypothetical protein